MDKIFFDSNDLYTAFLYILKFPPMGLNNKDIHKDIQKNLVKWSTNKYNKIYYKTIKYIYCAELLATNCVHITRIDLSNLNKYSTCNVPKNEFTLGKKFLKNHNDKSARLFKD